MSVIIETERLTIRRLTLDDAEFIRELLNDPDFLKFIGDRGVRTVDDAVAYLKNGPLEMYERLGFGLWCVELDGTQGAGARLLTNIVDVDVDKVRIGDKVKMVFHKISDTLTVPLAAPA